MVQNDALLFPIQGCLQSDLHVYLILFLYKSCLAYWYDAPSTNYISASAVYDWQLAFTIRWLIFAGTNFR